MNESSSVYINPLTDFGFKYLFGQEENKQFLLSFLNSLMEGEAVIEDVNFIDKERINDNKDGRALIYDLHCETSDGGSIIVEMQNRYQTHFNDRALFYLSGDIYNQGRKGKNWNYQLTPVYGVFMMNFDWDDDPEKHLREDIGLINIRTRKVFSDKLRMTFLKIPLMDKTPDECRDILDKWIYIMKNMETMETMPKVFMRDPVFKRLGEVAKVAALNPKDKKAYDRSLKIYRDNYAIAETERAQGKKEGLEEGIIIGKEEGIIIGKEEGIIIGKEEEKCNIAINLINIGMNDDDISRATGLSPEKVSSIRQNH